MHETYQDLKHDVKEAGKPQQEHTQCFSRFAKLRRRRVLLIPPSATQKFSYTPQGHRSNSGTLHTKILQAPDICRTIDRKLLPVHCKHSRAFGLRNLHCSRTPKLLRPPGNRGERKTLLTWQSGQELGDRWHCRRAIVNRNLNS